MREVALIQHLAQIGSLFPLKGKLAFFVIFSRLGASDDILRGQSTFMVEMSETAEILRHATEDSLIILDEVGRGTSTATTIDSLALSEHLINETKHLPFLQPITMNLLKLLTSSSVQNMTVETAHHNGKVQFLYRLIERPASQSYGIYVAECAGFPTTLLKRSQQILKKLEQDDQEENVTGNTTLNI